MPVTSYSRTAANNNSAPPNGAPEGWSPGSMNNTVRQIMTDIVNEATYNSAKVLGSVAGTNTITGSLTPAITSYTAGMLVVFTPAATNTSAVTININSLGALDIYKGENAGLALAPGDLTAGVPALLLLDSGADDFCLLNPTGYGSFTGTLTGMSGATTGTIYYRIANQVVTLFANDAISGTSNATTMTMTGVPSAIRPTARRIAFDAMLYNNSLSNPAYLGRADVAGSGTITFALLNQATGLFDTGGFTAGGNKGLHAGWSITYPLL